MTTSSKILTDEQIDAIRDDRVENWFPHDKPWQVFARAIEQAVMQSPEVVAMRWQPIETAPKDGRQILLTNGQSVAQGWWEHEEPYIREKRDIGGFYIGQDESDGFDGWLDCEGGMQPDPTHWMPLPAPPADAAMETKP